MKTIYKYPLQITDVQRVGLPNKSNILCVKTQNGFPCLWAEVDTDEKLVAPVEIYVCGTGNPLHEDAKHYIGTVFSHGGLFVWHIFTE